MITHTANLAPSRRRFTVDEFYRMAEAGILREDDCVELIDGEVIEMAPIGPWHASEVDRHNRVFHSLFSDVAIVRIQNPIGLNNYSLPQPDLALLRLRADLYRTAHPAPDDIFLIVEVADSSSAFDRGEKALAYARSGIRDYVVLERDTLTVHRDPTPEGYRSVQTLRRGDRLALLAFPDREIAVTDLLGTDSPSG